jgi:hypothetical protein
MPGLIGGSALIAATIALSVSTSHSTRSTDRPVDGCFRYAVRTDQRTYHRGVPVQLTVTATNIGTQPCRGRSCGGITPWFEVFDLRGRSAYRSSAVGIACRSDAPPPAVIAPGSAEVWADGGWDQYGPLTGVCRPGNCRPTQAPAAADWYRITWHWLDTVTVRTGWFELAG